jgi:flagellar basal-body rod protein FlgB
MSDLLTARLDGYGKALNLLSQRQKVLSGNIANADTPGFKARDFDFSAALAQARGQGNGNGVQVTSTRHLGAPAASGEVNEARLQYRASEQPSLDGNTVDLDRERANFADNAMRYEATLRFINNDVRTMLSAITGQ